MKHIMSRFLILFFICTTACFSKTTGTSNIFLHDKTNHMLETAIYDMADRQKAVAINIANASTPGYKPIRFQDEIDRATRLYGDPTILESVNIDDEMVRSTEIRLLHSMLLKLLKNKMDIQRKVVTLGKGG